MMFDRKHIDDHDLVARYLADQLSEAERESFEAYLLEHPESLKELNAAAQFKAGLADLNERGELTKLLAPRAWWQRASTLAAAASIALIVGAITWFSWQGVNQPLLAASVAELSRFQSTLPVVASHAIQRTRASSYDATIKLANAPAAVELRIRPEARAEPPRYRLVLSIMGSSGASKPLATVAALEPAPDGFVSVYLNAAKLLPGVYELILAADQDASAHTISSFMVEVVE